MRTNYLQYPRLVTSEAPSRYTWDGKPVPSVTEIISSIAKKNACCGGGSEERWSPIGFDDYWLKDDTASLFGKTLHKIYAIILNGGEPKYPEIMTLWVRQFCNFLQDWKIKPFDKNIPEFPIIEYPMYSERFKYSGTPDLICRFSHGKIKNAIGIFDWKSATSFQKYWRYQIAAYEKIARDIFSFEKDGVYRITVMFTEISYNIDLRYNNPEDWIGFQSLLNVWRM